MNYALNYRKVSYECKFPGGGGRASETARENGKPDRGGRGYGSVAYKHKTPAGEPGLLKHCGFSGW
jgi:hypothetical protein